jgi:ABC-type uncharacterized transport system fused permease/ATPase subunit
VPSLEANNNNMKPLFQGVQFTVKAGRSLAIMGQSGCGKSSLLRAIAGVWPIQAGYIMRPPKIPLGNAEAMLENRRAGLFFVPQRPFVTAGTLRDQLVYPLNVHEASMRLPAYPLSALTNKKKHALEDASVVPDYWAAVSPTAATEHGGAYNQLYNQYRSPLDTLLCALLRAVQLGHLVEHRDLDTTAPWRDLLSLGEQQRLGLVRLFFHRPCVALLDEATSALDAQSERAVMELCAALDIALVSVTHRPSVLEYHQQLLYLTPQAQQQNGEVQSVARLVDLAPSAAKQSPPPPPSTSEPAQPTTALSIPAAPSTAVDMSSASTAITPPTDNPAASAEFGNIIAAGSSAGPERRAW